MGAILAAIATLGTSLISLFSKRSVDVSAANEQDANLAMAQIKVNEVEAANPNLFVSGWRPYVGWVCAFAFTYDVFIRRIMTDIVFIARGITLPAIDTTDVITILLSLLGVAGLRTYEKLKGVTK